MTETPEQRAKRVLGSWMEDDGAIKHRLSIYTIRVLTPLVAAEIRAAEAAAMRRAARMASKHWPYPIPRKASHRPLGYYDGAHHHGRGIALVIRAEAKRLEKP